MSTGKNHRDLKTEAKSFGSNLSEAVDAIDPKQQLAYNEEHHRRMREASRFTDQ